MSNDPLSPKSPGAWVTAGPAHSRSSDLGGEPLPDSHLMAAPRSAHWGLASLIIGVPLLTATPVLLLLVRDFWTRGPSGMKVPVAFTAGLLGGGLVLGLAATGIVFGVRSWLLAGSERQPIALGLGGTLLNAVALLVLLGIFIDMMTFFFEHLR
jgi:hypothetical protein